MSSAPHAAVPLVLQNCAFSTKKPHSALKTVHWALKNTALSTKKLGFSTTKLLCAVKLWRCCGETKQCWVESATRCGCENYWTVLRRNYTAVLQRYFSAVLRRNWPLIITLPCIKQIIIKTLPIVERCSKKAAYCFYWRNLCIHARRTGTNIRTPAAVTYCDRAPKKCSIYKIFTSVKVAHQVIAIYFYIIFSFM